MTDLLKGKIVIVTGAAAGNGAGIAKMMAKEGATVCGWDISDNMEAVAEKMNSHGLNIIPFCVDIVDEIKIINTIEDIIHRYKKIDVLVNNAGVYPTASFLETSNALRNKIIEINVYGTWNCIKAVLPLMIKNRAGRIINISSVTGPRVVSQGMSAYAMSKGAVSALTRAVALETAEYGINVNAILPGLIDTPGVRRVLEKDEVDVEKMLTDIGKTVPIGKLGKIEDIGGAAVYLASEYSNYVTGQEIVVDGGNLLPEIRMEI